jgi:hypothetical protein
MMKSTFKNRNQDSKPGAAEVQNNKFDPYAMVMLRSEIVAEHNERFADTMKKVK